MDEGGGGVRKWELEGVDDASIPPVCAEESAISARLLASSLKTRGGDTDVVSGGGLQSGGGTELGRSKSLLRLRRMRFFQSTSLIFM